MWCGDPAASFAAGAGGGVSRGASSRVRGRGVGRICSAPRAVAGGAGLRLYELRGGAEARRRRAHGRVPILPGVELSSGRRLAAPAPAAEEQTLLRSVRRGRARDHTRCTTASTTGVERVLGGTQSVPTFPSRSSSRLPAVPTARCSSRSLRIRAALPRFSSRSRRARAAPCETRLPRILASRRL